MNKDCQLIQELFPLYEEELVSPETAEYIRDHLAYCSHCKGTWEQINRPLQEILPDKEWEREKEEGTGEKLFVKLKKTVVLVFCIFILGGLGIAYASYNAGRHVGLDDPSYRMVDELGLFTQINQTKILGDSEITLQKGIFDNSRTVLFLTVSNPGENLLEIRLIDNEGNEYLNKSSQVVQKKYYIAEFEPFELGSEAVRVVLNYQDSSQEIEFLFPIDITAALQYTRIIYPNLRQEVSGINIALQKAVLGVSQAEFKIKIDWPYDGLVSGIALGRDIYFPTSFSKLSDDAPPPPGPVAPGGIVPNYAAAYGVNYRSEDPAVNRPALYDLTQREEIVIQKGEYKTTQFPCQVEGSLRFDIVEPESEELELLLPPIYVFQKTKDTPQMDLDFTEEPEDILEKSIPLAEGIIKFNKAWLEDERVFVKYQVTKNDDKQDLIPNFVLKDEKGEKQGKMHFSRGEEGEVFFPLMNEGEKKYSLIVESIGQQLPRQKFSLSITDD